MGKEELLEVIRDFATKNFTLSSNSFNAAHPDLKSKVHDPEHTIGAAWRAASSRKSGFLEKLGWVEASSNPESNGSVVLTYRSQIFGEK